MLITELKPKDQILAFTKDKKVFAVECHGCKEVIHPFEEIQMFLQENKIVSVLLDYLCNSKFSASYISKHKNEINISDAILIFSCGVGAQSFSRKLFDNKEVLMDKKQIFVGCDTLNIYGFQGLTPLEQNCALCGKCYLNYTAAICPITRCSKGLLNGPCGGAKNGKCEVDKEMDCGWQMIFKRLEKIKSVDSNKIHLRDYKVNNSEKTL
jgi:hypothetical protein